MSIDLGLSFDSDDYQYGSEDADVFASGKKYEHTFNGTCELCERRHFAGLKIPVHFEESLKKHLEHLGVEQAQRFMDAIDAEATIHIPSQVSAIAIEDESKRVAGQQTIVFLRALAETLDELTGGELSRKITLFGLEEKIIDLHKSLKDLDKLKTELIEADETDNENAGIASRTSDLLEFSRTIRERRLNTLIDMYQDECASNNRQPEESVIKEGTFEDNTSMNKIMALLEGNEKL